MFATCGAGLWLIFMPSIKLRSSLEGIIPKFSDIFVYYSLPMLVYISGTTVSYDSLVVKLMQQKGGNSFHKVHISTTLVALAHRTLHVCTFNIFSYKEIAKLGPSEY